MNAIHFHDLNILDIVFLVKQNIGLFAAVIPGYHAGTRCMEIPDGVGHAIRGPRKEGSGQDVERTRFVNFERVRCKRGECAPLTDGTELNKRKRIMRGVTRHPGRLPPGAGNFNPFGMKVSS